MWKSSEPTSRPPAGSPEAPRPSGSASSARPPADFAASLRVAATHLPANVTITGDLNADEDVVIDGIVTGTIDMPNHALTVGPHATVDARVFARDVTLHGQVKGKLTALEIIDIRDSARVSGELAAPSVALADGAFVQGRVETKRVDAAVHVARYRMAKNAI